MSGCDIRFAFMRSITPPYLYYCGYLRNAPRVSVPLMDALRSFQIRFGDEALEAFLATQGNWSAQTFVWHRLALATDRMVLQWRREEALAGRRFTARAFLASLGRRFWRLLSA